MNTIKKRSVITTQAAIYHGQYDVTIDTLETPTVGPTDVLIQNLYAGMCGSDVAVFNHGTATGHKVGAEHEFGHEAISRVAAVGAAVRDFTVGERVYPYPLYARGDTSRAGSMGGFSEYILVPNAELNKQLYKVPATIDTRIATMIEPFTVGTDAARHGHPQVGEQAIVYGAGTIGIAAAVALTHFGVSQVVVVDQSDFRLAIAAKLGFATINNGREAVRPRATELLGSAQGLHGRCPAADIFIDAVGRSEIMQDFIDFGPIDSRFVAVGVNNIIADIDMLALIYGSKSIGGAGGYRPKDVTTVFDIMASHRFDLGQLITAEVDQAHLVDGIRQATDVDHALKVIVDYGIANHEEENN